MKKFLPLFLFLCLIFYGMISSYKKKIETYPEFFNYTK